MLSAFPTLSLRAFGMRLVLVVALAFAAVAFVAPSTPARADSTCAANQVCVWTGTFYSGTKTTYSFEDLADIGCANVLHRSLKIGASLIAAATSYGEENCFVLGSREDTVSLLGTPTGNPEFTFGTANSLSFLGVGA